MPLGGGEVVLILGISGVGGHYGGLSLEGPEPQGTVA